MTIIATMRNQVYLPQDADFTRKVYNQAVQCSSSDYALYSRIATISCLAMAAIVSGFLTTTSYLLEGAALCVLNKFGNDEIEGYNGFAEHAGNAFYSGYFSVACIGLIFASIYSPSATLEGLECGQFINDAISDIENDVELANASALALQDQVQQLQQQIVGLNSRSIETDEAREAALEDIVVLEDQLEAVRGQLQVATDTVEQGRREIERLAELGQREIERLTVQAEALQGRNEEGIAVGNQLRGELRDATAAIQENRGMHVAEIQHLQERLQAVTTEHGVAAGNAARLQTEMDQLRAVASGRDGADAQVVELQGQLRQSNETTADAARTIEDLNAQLQEANAAVRGHIGTQRELEASISRAEASLRDAQDAHAEQRTNHRVALQEATRQSEVARAEVARLEGQIEQLRLAAEGSGEAAQALADAQGQLRMASEAHNDAEVRVQDLTSQLQAAQAQGGELNEELLSVTSEYAALQASHGRMNERMQNLATQRRDAIENLEEAQAALEEKNAEFEELVRYLNEKNAEHASLEGNMTGLQVELARLRANTPQPAESATRMQELTAQLADVTRARAALGDQLTQKTEEYDGLVESHTTLARTVQDLREQIGTKDEELGTLVREVESLREQVEFTGARNLALTEENEALQARFDGHAEPRPPASQEGDDGVARRVSFDGSGRAGGAPKTPETSAAQQPATTGRRRKAKNKRGGGA
ncbi:MAG: hypothetical protein KAR79_05910 [Simkaniaceae bacterium]|nr:hypothetical protein [Simkaniaceae bacterium]